MKKLTWEEFVNIMYQHNMENNITTKGQDNHPIIGIVVYKQENFKRQYSEKERSYLVSSDNKKFIPGQIGQSIFADCLDAKDTGVRLDWYNWKVDYCYILEDKND